MLQKKPGNTCVIMLAVGEVGCAYSDEVIAHLNPRLIDPDANLYVSNSIDPRMHTGESIIERLDDGVLIDGVKYGLCDAHPYCDYRV